MNSNETTEIKLLVSRGQQKAVKLAIASRRAALSGTDIFHCHKFLVRFSTEGRVLSLVLSRFVGCNDSLKQPSRHWIAVEEAFRVYVYDA